MRAQRDNNDGGNRSRNRRGRVHHDTERAVIRVRGERVDVRHLHHGQQSQQDQTNHRYHRRVARQGEQLSAPVGLNSAQHQIRIFLNLRIHRMGRGVYSLRQKRSLPTPLDVARLKWWGCLGFLPGSRMKHVGRLLWSFAALLACAALSCTCAAAQSDPQQPPPQQKPLPLKPAMPNTGQNHRLILKDGSYQIVRKYEVVGDRVRYISVERGGDWEELPADLIDWNATHKWEHDQAQLAEDNASPAMKEAAAIDKEEAAERNEQLARMPEVAKGLELPDEDSVFALDTYQGTPELVELLPNELGIDAKTHKGLSTINPLAGQRAAIELPGAHAKAHLHVNDPAIYLSLDVTDDAEKVVSHALTVQTNNAKEVANRKHGAYSTQSGFAIVHVDERKAVRIVGAIHISPTGTVSQTEDVMPAKVEVLPGKHWVRIVPSQQLVIGEYALVEIISPSEINQRVWDFRVDPQAGDNKGSIGPILKQ
jgi:hypothetical protein